ncbi:MAG: hypothetical protein WBM69_09850 [Desulfobacterales bacterium]
MDTNPINCAKCGHTVKETAVACAYCGAAISSGDSPPQPGEEAPGPAAQSGEPSPLPADDSPPVLDMTDESANTPDGFEVNLDAGPSSQVQPKETQPEINEPATEEVAGAKDQSSDADGQIDFQLPDDEMIVELDAKNTAKDPEQGSGPDTVSAENKKPELKPDTSGDPDYPADLEQHAAEVASEVIPLAGKVSAKAASDDSPGLPETPVLEVSGEESSETETLGADILELVAVETSEAEYTRQQASVTAKSSDEPAVEKQAEIAPDPAPDGSDNKDGELEAILLTFDDDLQSVNPSLPADIEEVVKTGESEKPVELAAPTTWGTAKSDDSSGTGESQAKAEVIQKQTEAQVSIEALKIEKAAQELAEAQKKQKADIAKAQALKKQKLKLAKSQALKRKKAAVLKVQALKEQKEAQLLKKQREAQVLKKQREAQVLKKQKEAQVGIEKTIKEIAAGPIPPKVENPDMIDQSMEANTKILGLLKKYEGQAIGINYDNSADIKEAELVEANDEFFSVFVKDKELNYSHPLKTILTIIEGKDGVGNGKPEQEAKFNAVIKVYPLVLF